MPGYEIYARPCHCPDITDGLIHVYRARGIQDHEGRWIFDWVGGFTEQQFKEREAWLDR